MQPGGRGSGETPPSGRRPGGTPSTPRPSSDELNERWERVQRSERDIENFRRTGAASVDNLARAFPDVPIPTHLGDLLYSLRRPTSSDTPATSRVESLRSPTLPSPAGRSPTTFVFQTLEDTIRQCEESLRNRGVAAEEFRIALDNAQFRAYARRHGS
ncbi:hypothetical protein B0A50_00739 [Salinomyces thailandicus]|uniref:Uncharacterized protein n=1 Tax=Salinomyces thailandicus TaxID=706561 RepID=A0A4U0UF01_9PEZI|nr:hypothetical protein B0A50_00739 [Salinomyces thailandica]